MTQSLMLPLQLAPAKDHMADPLHSRISQINLQKGAFRNVTEKSLLQEIESQKAADGDVATESEDSDSPQEEAGNRQELVLKAKDEMMQQVDRARNETLTALDFVSFLLSKHAIAAQATMSPVLKQAVPIGSVEGRVVKFNSPSALEVKRLEQVSQGWKMNSFQSASDKVLAAASRLKDEAARESKYWEQISRLKAEGWSVSRLPKDSRTLGVHFGFTEATPLFRNRGFAVLRRGDDGGLRIDRGAIPAKPTALQVSILRKTELCGQSAVPKPEFNQDDSIEKQILQARNTLFGEELFYELGRESRILANQGVEMSAKAITFEIDNTYTVQINLVDLNQEIVAASKGEDDEIAEWIALSLRILLSNAHRQNLGRRSRAPPPMTLKARPVPEYVLLRPVMTHLLHKSRVDALSSFFEVLVPTLSNAGLEVKKNLILLAHMDLSGLLSRPKVLLDPFMDTLIAPLESTFFLTLPTARGLEVTVRTYLGQPTCGTEYNITPQTYNFTTLSAPRLNTTLEVEKFICHAVTLDLVSWIETVKPQKPGSKDDETAQETEERRVIWRATDPHSGELSNPDQFLTSNKMQVMVWRNRLGLRCVRYRQQAVRTFMHAWEADKYWTTNAAGRTETPRQTLRQVVQGSLSAERIID